MTQARPSGSPGGRPAAGSQDDVLQRVSQVVAAVARQLSTRDVLQMIVRSARSLVNARYAALGVPDDHGSFAEFVVDGIPDSQRRQIGPLPRQHGMLGVLLREGQPMRVTDIRADPRFEGWPDAHPDMSDFLGVPIRDGRDVLGIIFAACKRVPGGFTDRDERLLGLFASHAAIALTNARLYERGRELSVLEERARLARELHDAVSQKLFSIRAKARAAEVLVGRDPDRASAEIRSVAELSGQAHAELRAVIDGLAPPDLAAGGLAASLRSYAVLAGRTYGAEVRFHAAPGLPALGAREETAVYRVAQEALHNALRHSGAAVICVSLTARRRRVILEVTDRGRGFAAQTPLAAPDRFTGGLGLASMHERAASAGGTLTVRSAPGEGTLVRLELSAGRAAGRGAGRP
ncbi:MAG TPA: GAF domain-containing sensor histidine kinase [Streptosporangiaceae bacterium]|nr:GAF domain-containing sensor histidine kinase [Streptosporangiaceae bacterium]